MKILRLDDINLHDIGNEIQIAGTIWSGKGHTFITTVPGKDENFSDIAHMPLSLPEWETLLRQADLQETEMFLQDPSGKLVKVILRKTQRQIDSFLQWSAFQRDQYHCRYCWRTGFPLTVDHIDLWEEGGATVLDNLISACRPCNKARGRLQYDKWLESPHYLRVSEKLPAGMRRINEDVVTKLPYLRSLRVAHVRSR